MTDANAKESKPLGKAVLARAARVVRRRGVRKIFGLGGDETEQL
jgi:hypothetical protein